MTKDNKIIQPKMPIVQSLLKFDLEKNSRFHIVQSGTKDY